MHWWRWWSPCCALAAAVSLAGCGSTSRNGDSGAAASGNGGSAAGGEAGSKGSPGGASGSSGNVGGASSGGAGGRAGASSGGSGGAAGCEGYDGLCGTLDGAVVDLPVPASIDFLEQIGAMFWLEPGLGDIDSLLYLAGHGLTQFGESPLDHVLFKMPAAGPHADVFFCAGAGSTFTPGLDGNTIVLRSLSRLGKCSEHPGSDELIADVTQNAFVGGAFGQRAIVSQAETQMSGEVWTYYLDFQHGEPGETAAIWPDGFMAFRTAEAIAGATQISLIEPFAFETQGSAPLVACGGVGSFATAEQGLATLLVYYENGATLPACPGTPVDGELSAYVEQTWMQ